MAIAYVNTTRNGPNTPATSTTFAHNCGTGSNRLLVVSVGIPNSDRTITATYNGTSMTACGKVNTFTRRVYMFYLIAPSTGSNNVVVTADSECDFLGVEASTYTGCKQSAQPDSQTLATSSATKSRTVTVTTNADNCWSVICGRANTTVTAGTNCTKRGDFGDSNNSIVCDSNGAITPAGNFSMTIDTPSTVANGYVMNAFAPYVAPATSSSAAFFLKMIN